MICDYCEKEMKDKNTDSCLANDFVEFPNGEKLPSIPYDGNERCHDCNVKNGGFHHIGCDMERCPKCEGQLIGCGCLDCKFSQKAGKDSNV